MMTRKAVTKKDDNTGEDLTLNDDFFEGWDDDDGDDTKITNAGGNSGNPGNTDALNVNELNFDIIVVVPQKWNRHRINPRPSSSYI